MRRAVTTGITALGIAGASFALTVLNPFSASAQTETPSTTAPTQTEPTTPDATTPETPAPARPDRENCPDKGTGSGSSSGGTSTSSAALRVRAV
jgi:hypothetical protein